MFQEITRNWPIKGAALLLALMLYVAVQLQQPITTSFDVTLNVQLPPGRALLQKPPKVRVQISGKGSQILKLRSLAGDITRRVPDTLTTSSWAIHLDPAEVELSLPKGADVRVLEVRPNEITLALDSVTRKEVRIVSLVTVTPESGQVLHGGLSMTPTTVRLVGPEKSLAAIESVTTVPVEITSVSGEFTRNVPIDTMPLGIVRLSPKHVTVTGEMGRIAERSFGGIPVETGAGAPPPAPPPSWLTPSSASRRRATRPRRPCWSAVSSRVSSSCRRTFTRSSAASSPSWRAARISPPCRRSWIARSRKPDSRRPRSTRWPSPPVPDSRAPCSSAWCTPNRSPSPAIAR
ncbi:MAG: hypothetical protein DMD59_11610 [Gemmatimonadetes bacterium]|nr:MAG: hypothetical protein DMD59_11610 [Gemmatimonadota bacterium]